MKIKYILRTCGKDTWHLWKITLTTNLSFFYSFYLVKESPFPVPELKSHPRPIPAPSGTPATPHAPILSAPPVFTALNQPKIST